MPCPPHVCCFLLRRCPRLPLSSFPTESHLQELEAAGRSSLQRQEADERLELLQRRQETQTRHTTEYTTRLAVLHAEQRHRTTLQLEEAAAWAELLAKAGGRGPNTNHAAYGLAMEETQGRLQFVAEEWEAITQIVWRIALQRTTWVSAPTNHLSAWKQIPPPPVRDLDCASEYKHTSLEAPAGEALGVKLLG